MSNHENWKALMEKDAFIKLVGLKLEEARPGYAKVCLKIEAKHLNALGSTQGGAIFTLADYAFALATNAHGLPSVGLHADISFLHTSKEGSVLTAIATMAHQGKSIGLYQVNITDEENRLIAVFSGNSFTLQPKK